MPPLCSRITVESAELLGLHANLPVIALCKATAVSIAGNKRARPGVNRLPGLVTRAHGSGADSEVSLKLESGIQLVGFASAAAEIASAPELLSDGPVGELDALVAEALSKSLTISQAAEVTLRQAIAALGAHFGLTLDRHRCFPYGR